MALTAGVRLLESVEPKFDEVGTLVDLKLCANYAISDNSTGSASFVAGRRTVESVWGKLTDAEKAAAKAFFKRANQLAQDII